MPLPTFFYPLAFNTLDDNAFDDGHALNAYAVGQAHRNDRRLDASLVRCLHHAAWPLADPYIHKGSMWVLLTQAIGATTPGRNFTGRKMEIDVHGRGVISPAGLKVVFAVATSATYPTDQDENFAAQTEVTGTGATQNWTVGPVEIVAGNEENVRIYAKCLPQEDAAGDITGALTAVGNGQTLTDAAAPTFNAGGAGVPVQAFPGYVVRLEDPAAPLHAYTDWRTVVECRTVAVAGDTLDVYPAFGITDYWLGQNPGTGFANYRCRPVAELELYSLAVEEREKTV